MNCLEILVSHSWATGALWCWLSQPQHWIHQGPSGYPRFTRAKFRQPRSLRWVFQSAYTTSCRSTRHDAASTWNFKRKGFSWFVSSWHTQRHFKKTDPWYEVSYCIIMSLSLERCSHEYIAWYESCCTRKPFQRRCFSVKTPKIWTRMDVNTRASKCRSHHRGGQQEVK